MNISDVLSAFLTNENIAQAIPTILKLKSYIIICKHVASVPPAAISVCVCLRVCQLFDREGTFKPRP